MKLAYIRLTKPSPVSGVFCGQEFFSGTSVAETLERDRRLRMQQEVNAALRDIREAMKRGRALPPGVMVSRARPPEVPRAEPPVWVARPKAVYDVLLI